MSLSAASVMVALATKSPVVIVNGSGSVYLLEAREELASAVSVTVTSVVARSIEPSVSGSLSTAVRVTDAVSSVTVVNIPPPGRLIRSSTLGGPCTVGVMAVV